MDGQYYKLAIQGRSNITACGPVYNSLQEAIDGANVFNKRRNGKKLYTHISVYRNYRKVDCILLPSEGPEPTGSWSETAYDTTQAEFHGYRRGYELLVEVRLAGDVTFQAVPWRTDEYSGSPTGLECGYSGAGPTQLAYTMLRSLGFTKNQALAEMCFVRDRLVAKLPREDAWTVTENEIRSCAR